MENDTTLAKEGLLEPVLPGSVTFDNSILAPLRNNYLYEESKECFTYASAYLINNATLQRRYSAFRTEKKENGYSEEDLEESFGFLLFDDEQRANKLADTGLMVGQGTCTTLGDSSKGVYISKYSDCLDLKRWYDGKTGYIVLLKLTKGRVKEVTENYTQNFTPPSSGFDCHVSEQLGAVCTTTSSFLAFERTQYYMYELLDGGSKAEPCPRHVRPFAVVAFSYGKTTTSLQLMEKSHEKTAFHYQPWSGQLKINSVVYDIGFKSFHGAMFPANLPKTVKVDHAIEISELRKTLPQAVFETSFVGEVSLDTRCFSLYDVVPFEASNDLSLLTQELKEKDMALVLCLDDGGFLVLLHSSHFFTYEGAGTDKGSALQGLFIFPDSRAVPRETKRLKSAHFKPNISPEVLQILPALNYAESEMEKSPPNQQGEPLETVEKHLQNFASLILPGLSSSPAREASMFPDQYDVPDGFPLIAPKWTDEAGVRLKTYLENPCRFQIPVSRALELLAAGKQQRNDDDPDDDVYYYISSPEEAPRTPADMTLERGVIDAPDHISVGMSDEMKNTDKQPNERQNTPAESSLSALPEEEDYTPSKVVAASSDSTGDRTNPSPKSGDLPEHCAVNAVAGSEKTSQSVSVNDESGGVSGKVSKETPVEIPSVLLTEARNDVLTVPATTSQHFEADAGAELDASKKEDCMTDVLTKDGGPIPGVDQDVLNEAGLPISISTPTASENQTDTLVEDAVKVQPNSDVPQNKLRLKRMPRRRGRRKMKALRQNLKKVGETPTPVGNTTSPSCSSVDATPEQSVNSERAESSPSDLPRKDWRSLPRRKRFWHANVTEKRVLRSGVKNSESESIVEKSLSSAEPSVTRTIITSTPKRKMEGVSMRERYGLKTIITECGRVFVPHGSEVGDIKSSTDTKDGQDSSLITTTSLGTEKPSCTPPALQMGETLSTEAPSCQEITEKDTTSLKNSDQSSDSDPKICKTKDNLYKAISISKLKTVLKRAKRTKSPGPSDRGKPASDNAEPEPKKERPNTDLALATCGNLGGQKETEENSNLCPPKDTVDTSSKTFQNNPNPAGSEEPSKNVDSQSLVSWKELKIPSEEKLIPKENGCINYGTSAPYEIVKQADQQLKSALTEDRVGGKHNSSESKNSNEALVTGASLPSDALNLLADLALSVNSDKLLRNPAKPRQETKVGVKSSTSPSVLHALLQCSSAKLKLPPRSPFPDGLVVPGDVMLEISKEHSYSQPTSLSGLSGACPQVPPPAGCVESPLFLNPKLQLKLPEERSGSKNEQRHTSSDVPPSSTLKPNARRQRFLHHRRIIAKEGSIQVARLWGENYDFKFDSRFTNDRLEKCVARALHGKWDFSIEDTYEQVHLIFHMWIGLFYSKPTSRFFHLDHNSTLLERKDSPKVSDNIQACSPLTDDGVNFKEDKTSSLHPVTDVLDLSVRATEPSNGGSEENPTSISDIRSRQEHTVESNQRPLPSSFNSPSLSKLDTRDYRSTVDILEESPVPDNDGFSDLENDTVTESSYTKLLENNSAYSHLCEQASNMHIDEDRSSKRLKNVIVYKKRLPPAPKIGAPAKVASGTVTSLGPKAVFHQVVAPISPVILSRIHDKIPDRKTILNRMSLRDKIGGEVRLSRHDESVSKDENTKALSEKNGAQVNVHSGNSKEEIAFKTPQGSSSASSVVLCDENTKMKSNSALDSRGDTSVGIHDVTESTVETIKSMANVRDDGLLFGERNGIPLPHDIPMDVHDVNDAAMEEVKSVRDVETTHDRNDTTGRIHTDKTEEKVRPIPEVIDETPKFVHDIKNKQTSDVSNNEAKDVGKPVQDVEDGTLVQDGNDKAKDADKPVHGVEDSTPVSIQDVNDKTEEEASMKSAVGVCASVTEHHDGNMEAMAVHDVINAKVIKEHGLEKCEKIIDEEIRESHESEKREQAQLICKTSSNEMDLEERRPDESEVSDLEKDCIAVDMQICDEKDLEDEIQGKVNEVHASSGEAVSEHMGCPAETVKLHLDEIMTRTFLVSSDEEDISDSAPPEMEADSSADYPSSTAHQLIMLNEGHTSPAADDTTETNGENTMLCLSPMAENEGENETPVVSQAEPEKVCSDVSPSTLGTILEAHTMNEASPKAADYLAVSNTTLKERDVTSKDLQSQEEDPDQNCAAPAVCKLSVDEMSLISSNSREMTPPALQIDTDSELNSRSCTPTQDELPYNQEGSEDLLDNHSFERELHCVNRSPTTTGLSPVRPVCPPINSERPSSNSPGDEEQSSPQDTCWSVREYDTTVNVTDSGKLLISKHVPKQNLPNFDHHRATPKPRDRSSNPPQKNQFDELSEQYEEQSSELPLSWLHGSSFKPDGPEVLREPHAYDEDSEDPPIHFRNNTFFHREAAQMPRKTVECDADITGWEQQVYYAGSMSSVEKSDERSFRHKADLCLSKSHDDSDSICYSRKKPKRTSYRDKWDQEHFHADTEDSIRETFSCGSDRTKTLRTVTSSPYQYEAGRKQSFDWRRYFKREGVFHSDEKNHDFAHVPPSSIITVFDKKGNRAIFENASTLKRSVGTTSLNVKDSLHNWEDERSKSEITQSLMEREYLIFSEKMTQMLKTTKVTRRANLQQKPNVCPPETAMTIQFSRLAEQESSVQFDEAWPTLTKLKINVDMSERKGTRETMKYGKPLHLQSLFCERGNETACSKISDITKDCAKSYKTMMNDVCIGKTVPRHQGKAKRKWDAETAAGGKQSAFCGHLKKAMFDHLHDNLNSIVRQACKIKYRFYILVTSADPFFKETKDLLEAEGHTAVELCRFDIDDKDQPPLLIILRNEDIAEHICEVPHLLNLKKSSGVFFAGIDRPDDVVNLTHQELFAKGGFVVFDEIALDRLTLENMKKVVGIMEELDKKGKWKWFLHYRDSRKLRENARCSPEAQTKKNFIDCCQEAGIVEVLPYHECDVISRDRPDYLRCLVRLQIQNASARFPVFITVSFHLSGTKYGRFRQRRIISCRLSLGSMVFQENKLISQYADGIFWEKWDFDHEYSHILKDSFK